MTSSVSARHHELLAFVGSARRVAHEQNWLSSADDELADRVFSCVDAPR